MNCSNLKYHNFYNEIVSKQFNKINFKHIILVISIDSHFD